MNERTNERKKLFKVTLSPLITVAAALNKRYSYRSQWLVKMGAVLSGHPNDALNSCFEVVPKRVQRRDSPAGKMSHDDHIGLLDLMWSPEFAIALQNVAPLLTALIKFIL